MLADKSGTPLIVHCAKNAMAAACVDHVCIASDSESIEAAATAAGIDHRLTRGDHPNGTSRIAEIADSLEADIIVNVQGDEPELDPSTIDAAIDALRCDPDAGIATVAAPCTDPTHVDDVNVVKVVVDQASRAIYFSRAPIPCDRDGAGVEYLRHVGLYVYTPEALHDYVQLPPGVLEQTEQLEQLRLLEHARPIAVARVETCHCGIDTPQQYEDWLQRRA